MRAEIMAQGQLQPVQLVQRLAQTTQQAEAQANSSEEHVGTAVTAISWYEQEK